MQVGLSTCTFVDTTRTTYDYATHQLLPYRRLVTDIFYPTTEGGRVSPARLAPPAYRRGPFPLVLFAHGFAVDPMTYAPLLDAWVKAGFVVAAPIFPDTNQAAVRAAHGLGEADMTNQPGDVAFVANQLRAAMNGQSSTCAFVRGLIKPGPIAAAGQSDGADTVAALAYWHAAAGLLAGLDLKAVEVLSGAELDDTVGAYGAAPGGPAMLMVQSEYDTCNTPQSAATLYDAVAQPDKWFLMTTATTHLGPYDGREPTYFSFVVRATTAFLDAELKGGSPSSALEHAAAGATGLVALTEGGSAPAMPSLTFDRASCFVDR